ncbi:monooxygenase [Marimonas lutisalis]|uniref:monooxygenase n=1 Tax=Marimonas lutisalis TaxID=2545756 RepID=UPI0010F97BBF|nr:monooxygenase [Marimonas lutisalis]
MITEIVNFDLPEGMTREEAVALYEKTVPRWQANEALVRKYYLYDEENRIGGGVYLWPSIEDAKAAHDAAWCDMAEKMYGSRPRFQYFETPVIVDNAG